MRSGKWEDPYDIRCRGECGLTCSDCVDPAWTIFLHGEHNDADEMEAHFQAFLNREEWDPWEELMSDIRQAVETGSWKRH